MASPEQLERILAENEKYRRGAEDGSEADLTSGDFQGMHLVGYTFDGAILKDANFKGADLTSATLTNADISGADFRDASITRGQAISAKGWLLAKWPPVVLDELGLPTDHNERVGSKDFRGYRLRGACLNDLDLSSAVLAEAMLDKTTLEGSSLEFASLEEASLRNAGLTNALGLSAYQLRGADLTLAKLPPEIAESLNTQPGVDEATKTSRKVLLTMLAACLYCWLTMLSTTDEALLAGNSTLALPIIQTPIPVVAFFGAAPALLLIVYLYLHFSLQNLWDALATLPAFFPDGRPVHERALPWILSPIVRLYFKRLAPSCPRLSRFQVRVTSLLVWWGVPLTLLAFSLRFLVRRNPLISTLQVTIVAVAVGLAVMLWRTAKDTLRGIRQTRSPWRRALLSREVLVGVVAGALLAVFSAGCFYGETFDSFDGFFDEFSWRTAAPKLLNLVGWSAFGTLGADLSRRPNGWNGKDLDAVGGAQLDYRSLKGMTVGHVLAVRADFVGSDLRQSRFYGTDLRGANFDFAHLEQASFSECDLRFATFREADLSGASIEGCNVQGADFRQGADEPRRRGFPRPKRLALEHLFGVDTSNEIDAWNWFLAHFDESALRELKICDPVKPCDHEDRLSRKDFSGIALTRFGPFVKADLSGANLQHSSLRNLHFGGVDLSKADLRHADLNETSLGGANLAGADLRGADLKTVNGLTREQIESALIDDKTELPDYLKVQKPFTPKQ